MKTHTPGPWHCNLQLRGKNTAYVISSVIDHTKITRVPLDRPKDAFLIAAAPELLASLKQTYSDLQRYAPNSLGSITARAIIAQAEGK